MITFSTKQLTLKDQILLQRIAKDQDLAALLELIVRRSDPPVTEAQAGDLESGELNEVMLRLKDSIASSTRLDSMITDALAGIKPDKRGRA